MTSPNRLCVKVDIDCSLAVQQCGVARICRFRQPAESSSPQISKKRFRIHTHGRWWIRSGQIHIGQQFVLDGLVSRTYHSGCHRFVNYTHLVYKFGLLALNYKYTIYTAKTKQTVKLDASTVEIEERGVKLRLTVVDTPGFGDAIDNSDRCVY